MRKWGGGLMAQTEVQTEDALARIESERKVSKQIAVATRKQHKRYIPPFWRHFLEMNIAMWVGMGLGVVIFGLLFAAFGTSRDEIRLHHPAYILLLMVFEMTVAMVAWMRYRGHGWRGCAEMAAAMVVPAIPLIACLQTHVLTIGPTNGLYMASMPVAMLALMFYRRSEYSMQM
jgi:hypothetical protein